VTEQRTERQRTERQDDPNQQTQRPVRVSQTDTQEEPEELKEYHYYIGYIEHTALMTEEMAETMNAKPVGEPLDEPNINTNEERRGSVQAPGYTKARTPRNKQR
jgi:hypothetical protein